MDRRVEPATPSGAPKAMAEPNPLALDAVHQGDCLELLARLPDAGVHLAFADPPFNIGYDYDTYDDRRPAADYLEWSRQWMGQVARVLRPDGTFWLAIGDEYAAELKVMATRELGFTCRSWVVWYYTFGVNCRSKFSRSHAHLFHLVKDPEAFTFNADSIRVPSARELVYGDKRAATAGRLPDDTWILRPQDLPDGFTPEENTWYFPRVCGTFKERSGWHGCQMPEQLLGRIIRASSQPGDTVLDPFGGSGTTLAVAKKLGRRFLGFELSEAYAERIRQRLASAAAGDPLDGAPEPLKSAPATADGRRLDRQRGSRPAGRRAAGRGRQAELF
jgi:DNA modification methylase